MSYHSRSGRGRELELLEHLRSGRDLALITDAGTPLVSDPGGELASAWAAEGGAVVPIPGASAVLAAVVASGLSAARWTFEGFLPRSGRERRDRLTRIASDERACVIYEAPSRVPATLADLAAAAGAERRAAVSALKLEGASPGAAAGGIVLRGEFAIVVEAATAASARSGATAFASVAAPATTMAEARAEVARLVAEGHKRSEAVRHVAVRTGLDRRELYREA